MENLDQGRPSTTGKEKEGVAVRRSFAHKHREKITTPHSLLYVCTRSGSLAHHNKRGCYISNMLRGHVRCEQPRTGQSWARFMTRK